MMNGGMNAWKGITAHGFPETSMPLLPPTLPVGEIIALAWVLEEGTQRFYDGVSAMLHDPKSAALFHDLASAEENHKALLSSLYAELLGTHPQEDDLSRQVPDDAAHGSFIEGGIRLEEALAWLPGRRTKDILELSIGLETNAYDRYLTLARAAPSDPSRRVFSELSREEKQHLQQLTEVFEQAI